MQPNQQAINDFERRVKTALRQLPRLVGNEVLNFAADNFRNQGFMGDTFEAWPKRKNPNKWGQAPKRNGRAILIDRGTLRRGNRVIRADWQAIIIGNSVKYARAHNEGVRLGIIQKVASFNRKVAARTYFKSTVETPAHDEQVKEHTRKINQYIPRRRFLGNSQYLQKRLVRISLAHINKSLR